MHKSQGFGYLLASFLVGVALASFVKGIIQILIPGAIISVAILGISSYRGTFGFSASRMKRRKLGFFMGFVILFFLTGIWRFSVVDSQKSILKEFAGREVEGGTVPVKLYGYVDGNFLAKEERAEFPLKVKYVVAINKALEANEKILVQARLFPKYEYGEKLELEGEVRIPQNFSEFDYVAYLKKEGIGAVISYPEIASTSELNLGFWEQKKVFAYKKIFAVKDRFENSINKSIPEPVASYLNGILTGSRQNIPDNLMDQFQKTGLTHVLAISGYNITIIADSLLLLLIFFMKRRKAFWVSVGVIIVFTILTGASASVVRAAIMGLLFLFASGYGRLYSPKNSILLAGALMVLINPMVLVFDVGFQLSFLAVVGLLYLYPALKDKFLKTEDANRVKELALMTFSAQLAVLPLIIYYFGQFPLYSLPANLIVLPFIPMAMFLGFFSGTLGLVFVPFGKLAGYFAWAISTFQIKVIEFFASLPKSSVVLEIGPIFLVISYIALLVLFIFLKRERKKYV